MPIAKTIEGKWFGSITENGAFLMNIEMGLSIMLEDGDIKGIIHILIDMVNQKPELFTNKLGQVVKAEQCIKNLIK